MDFVVLLQDWSLFKNPLLRENKICKNWNYSLTNEDKEDIHVIAFRTSKFPSQLKLSPCLRGASSWLVAVSSTSWPRAFCVAPEAFWGRDYLYAAPKFILPFRLHGSVSFSQVWPGFLSAGCALKWRVPFPGQASFLPSSRNPPFELCKWKQCPRGLNDVLEAPQSWRGCMKEACPASWEHEREINFVLQAVVLLGLLWL